MNGRGIGGDAYPVLALVQPGVDEALPARQRAAVVLRFAVDLRYREVGEALGTSEEAARQNVHEALKKLRTNARDLKEMVR